MLPVKSTISATPTITMNYRLAQIELTNHCNKSCSYCFRKYMTRPQGYMTRETFKQSLQLCKKHNIHEVWLHNWGEPLLHKSLCDFINMAWDFTVGFVTNGDLLTYDMINRLGRTKLRYIDISVNADMGKFEICRILVKYQHLNDAGIDCRLRAVINTKEEYIYLSDMLSQWKVRWQRAMIRDETRVRTRKCEAKHSVFVVLWDGIQVMCCNVVNKEDNKKEYCRHCFESDADIGVRYKL